MRLRTGIRALVVDANERIALVRFVFPARTLLEGATKVDFAPRRLPTLLRELLRDRPPVEPIDVGV